MTIYNKIAQNVTQYASTTPGMCVVYTFWHKYSHVFMLQIHGKFNRELYATIALNLLSSCMHFELQVPAKTMHRWHATAISEAWPRLQTFQWGHQKIWHGALSHDSWQSIHSHNTSKVRQWYEEGEAKVGQTYQMVSLCQILIFSGCKRGQCFLGGICHVPPPNSATTETF